MTEAGSTRERLVAAAFSLFEERGYDGASVDDIAARAGVGRTTAFRQFGSKEAMIFFDHELLLHRAEERLSDAPIHAISAEVIASANLVFEHYLAEGERARSRYQLTSSVPALRHFEITTVSRYVRLFARHLRNEVAEGNWTDELRAELFAHAVVAAHNHVLRRWLRRETSTPREDLAEALACTWPILRSAPGGQTGAMIRTCG